MGVYYSQLIGPYFKVRRANVLKGKKTHAHTCEPRSGITVKRTWSLSRRIHTSLPRDDSDAVNSGTVVNSPFHVMKVFSVLVKVLIFLIAALNLILSIHRRCRVKRKV